MLERFSHIMIYTQQHETSVQWYCDKLGFEVDYNALGVYASLHHKNLGRLAIHATSSKEAIGQGPMPYLQCDDIKKTIEELRNKGVKVGEPQREGESPWFTDMWDFEGNVWGIEEK